MLRAVQGRTCVIMMPMISSAGSTNVVVQVAPFRPREHFVCLTELEEHFVIAADRIIRVEARGHNAIHAMDGLKIGARADL